jgi:DNA primase
MKQIKDVEVGELVLDRYGKLEPILAKETKQGGLLKISTSAFRKDPLALTPDHTCIWVKEDDAKAALPFLYNHKGRGTRFKGAYKHGKKAVDRKVVVTEGPAAEIRKGDFLLFPVIPEEQRTMRPLYQAGTIRDYTKGPANKRVASLPVSAVAARLYGLYLAEGSTGPREVRFTFALDEEHTLAKDTQDILRQVFGLESTIKPLPEHNRCEVMCSKTDLARQLEYWFGKGAASKKIPGDAMFWPVEVQRSLLKAYLDGDGRRRQNKSYESRSVSKQLSYGIFALSIQAGLNPSLARKDAYDGSDGTYHQESWVFGSRLYERLSGFFYPIGNTWYFWSQVSEIAGDLVPHTVVDISVANSTSFVTKLAVVHNCGAGGDMLDAAHFTDGLPLSGPGWLSETLPRLCAEFGVELRYENKEVTPEQQREFDIYQAYERACRLVVTGKRSDLVEAKIAEYGWSGRTLRVFGIGGIESFDKFVRALTKMGYKKAFLAEIGLTDERIFRPECLIFTIKDAAGRPIGFSARYLYFEREQKRLEDIKAEKGDDSEEYSAARKATQPKYVNTGSKNPLYKKSETLFGFHASRGTSKDLYVFEGNADAVTAYDRGLINSSAVCGSSFNDNHLGQILDSGVNHLICCFDGDKAGREASRKTAKLCEERLAGRPDVRAEFIDLVPPEGEKKTDPDAFVRTLGLAAFRKLARHSYLFWLWRDRMAESDGITVAAEAAQKILVQPDPLLRYDMLANLRELTGIPLEFLWETVVRLAGQADTPIARDILASADWMRAMREDAERARKAIEQARASAIKAVDAAPRKVLDGELVPLRRKAAAPAEDPNVQTARAAETW